MGSLNPVDLALLESCRRMKRLHLAQFSMSTDEFIARQRDIFVEALDATVPVRGHVVSWWYDCSAKQWTNFFQETPAREPATFIDLTLTSDNEIVEPCTPPPQRLDRSASGKTELSELVGHAGKLEERAGRL